MKIAINGIGVAGPALAWWLKHSGFEPVLFEKAPALRTGGYVIDFWVLGYDIAEKMGILPVLKEKGYMVNTMKTVDAAGKCIAELKVDAMAKLINNRFLSIQRGELASALFNACKGIESRFGTSVIGIHQEQNGLELELSDGSVEHFDLVIGADGLHSEIRRLSFGDEPRFSKDLGFMVAAFELENYSPREDLTYTMHVVPKRQIARFSLRDGKTLFLLTFRKELLESLPESEEEKKAALKKVFEDMKWETPEILAGMEEVSSVYFDSVTQIKMDKWCNGRVGLLGDAAACVSLLAGEGTGLAMTEAYVLAGELHKAQGDFEKAFANYQMLLQPFLLEKQQSALSFANFFAPKSSLSLWMRNMGIRLSNIPLFANMILKNSLSDNFDLPEY